MSEAKKLTITVVGPVKEPWQKPGSNQFWYSIATEEFGEPVKFIQDKDKGAPAPKDGEKYEGNLYEVDGGVAKFYPFKKGSTSLPLKAVDKPSGSSPASTIDSKYLKDLSDYPVRVFTGSLGYASQAGLNLIGDEGDLAAYLEFVRTASDELLKFSENIRNGS